LSRAALAEKPFRVHRQAGPGAAEFKTPCGEGHSRRWRDNFTIIPNRLLKVGVVGAVVTALCCLTPLLVLLLGAVGLSAAVGVLDYVLLPALVVFVGMILYALLRRRPA
jgi:mercuric ion transport protein